MQTTLACVIIATLSILAAVACDASTDVTTDVSEAISTPTAMPVPEPTNTSEPTVADQVDATEIPMPTQADVFKASIPEISPKPEPTDTPTIAPTPTDTPTPTPTPVLVATLQAESSVDCGLIQCSRKWNGENQLRLENGRYVIERSGENCSVQFTAGSTYSIGDYEPVFDRWLKTGIYTWYTRDEGCRFELYKSWETEKPEPTATPVLTTDAEIWQTIQGVGSDHICHDFARMSLISPVKLGGSIYNLGDRSDRRFKTYNTLARRFDLTEIIEGEFWVWLYDNCQDYVPVAATATVVAEQQSLERQIWDVFLAPNTRYAEFRDGMCRDYSTVQDPEQDFLDWLWETLEAAEQSGAAVKRFYPDDFRFTVDGYHEAVSRNCKRR